MGNVELAGRGPHPTPTGEVSSLARELHDAIVGRAAMAVCDEDGTIRSDDDIRRTVEDVGAAPETPRLAERQEHLAVGAELDNLMTLAGYAVDAVGGVGDPDVAVAIDVDAMRRHEHPGAKAGDNPPV